MNQKVQSSNSDRKAFKDYFDAVAVADLGKQMKSAWKNFPTASFRKAALADLDSLEFSQRVSRIAECLRAALPSNVPQALSILTDSLPPALPNCDSVTDGWLQWPIGQFIADYGTDYFDESMTAMIQLTQVFTSEFAVRPFMIQSPQRTIERLFDLTQHPSPHVRRWCSEGVRPRLPWGSIIKSLVKDPAPILPILDTLHNDEELYVRRSVANNLNDIAKNHPAIVIDRCLHYQQLGSPHSPWVIRHALRTLIKDGHQDALALLGYHPPRRISARLSVSPKTAVVGDTLELTSTLLNASKRSQQLAIDFELTFVRQNQKSSAKVFKWKSVTLSAGEQVEIVKRHSMKATTVRKLYAGEHKIRLMVNGAALAETDFSLSLP